ncbi:TPA: HlyD family efflux transporter periplasmic adaptor subunit [Escherichia coli]|jgi:membrane fusion protein, adhesin transport system|uniref:HlyD family efflux transporter periplasmic adaptor subunit n=5 Tax=Gammaproteobacteria TaxID=1236 RepID=A0A5C9ATX9_ECOLX|nr:MULTISPECIES: HlyD family efflux transporter periplasmic adaptor subunit [Gammaproteobacteria]KGH49100.1 secretion protein HlyD [Acinetobacter idrijaensis]MCV9564433.1 HlyD family efflux transporter periplasmic adaptor subunit [Salmonella enterica subsp. enterica serovar Senftenberg]HDR2727965.1 HlyD family efflux transporter periplasmic adaptor subunit [Enterobacter roggenkampii]AUT39194.1 secretion protein HlyD [Acinetobacter baumannii]EFB5409154.1 HlyD family efflux transporter periplasm
MNEQPQQTKRPAKASFHEPPLPKSSMVIWIIGLGLLVFFIWAALFKLEEVSTGTGKVIPSSKEQIIQSLEGGILTKLDVKEGDIVEKGTILAQLDPTRFASNVGESQSLLVSSLATSARLRAEVNGTALQFPEIVQKDSQLVREETQLYNTRRKNLEESISDLTTSLTLVQQELRMTEPLVAKGAASEVEVLRLKRQASDLQKQINDTRSQYYVKAREELSKANTDVETQRQIVKGKSDTLNRTVFRAPVRGVVKEIDVMTLGGVIPPNGKIMTIVPLDEQLLIEARISPRDIAFIRPNQQALVKITAYDYAIYGGLHGKVTVISPDTIRDEVKQDQFYYRVYIRTDSDKLRNKQGKTFAITPGMVATVDIRTGQKTVLDYLIKPFNKAREALRER